METIAATVADKETRPSREMLLRDFVRFSWRATRGLTSAAETEGRELVRQMVDSERLTAEEGKRLVGTLMARMEMSRQVFEKRVDASVRRAMERLGELSTREVTALREKTVDLEKRVDSLLNRKRGR